LSEGGKPYAIPWRRVESWRCTLCGKCCINHRVPLLFEEYAKIEPKYGPRSVEPGEKGFYVRRLPDGSCYFLRRLGAGFICSIQEEKPYVCRMFPFRVAKTARYGNEKLSVFYYRKGVFYVYLDPECQGIALGQPSVEFVTKVIPEFIDIYLGNRPQQRFSTGILIMSSR